MTGEIRNAIISGASLDIEDHGCLTARIRLDYGGTGQGFGGHVLQLPRDAKHWRLEGPAGHFIFRVLEVAGVTSWDKLVGKTVRVRAEWSRVQAIGHIVKDDWFEPDVDFADPAEGVA